MGFEHDKQTIGFIYIENTTSSDKAHILFVYNEQFTKIDHIMGHKANLNKFQK